ncbi:hypothetical protein ACIQYZ_14685 [Rhodococcus erythropolis]
MTGVDVEHTKARLSDLRTQLDVCNVHGITPGPTSMESAVSIAEDLVAEVETLRERVRRDEPSMPAEYNGGFGGCTDRNPDVCACGQDTDEECSICGEVIESGEMCQMLTRAVHPGLPNHHRDQDWEHIVWHADCATKAQAEADEAQKQFEEWIGGSNDL